MERAISLRAGHLTNINWKEQFRSILPLLILIIISIVFHWLSQGSFLTPRNLSNLSRQVCVNLTLAVGMTLVILTSGIDLSVGSILALSGMVAAISQVHWHWADMGYSGAMLSSVLALGVAGLCGLATGLLVSRLNIVPFIATLGMMVICRGLTLIISGAQAVSPIGDEMGSMSSNYLPIPQSNILLLLALVLFLAFQWRQGWNLRSILYGFLFYLIAAFTFCGYRGIPFIVFFAAGTAVAGVFVLKYLRYGRFLYAIGGNREAAEISGVPVSRVLLITYLVMGLLAGLAGVLDVARVNGAVPSAGELAELDAIAAVVIGGTSLMGGSGSVGGTLMGVLIMGILNNGMSLVGVSEHYQKVFKGLVIVLAVYLDQRSKKKN